MADQTDAGDHVIFPPEAEAYVKELAPFSIADIGSSRWSLQRERLEQLNLQAVYNITQQSDEFVKDFLSTHDKIPVLVHELLAVELWKERVLPLMLGNCSHPKTSFPAYLVLYHEGTVASLLETALFYVESCESAEDCILDLVDYCQRKITALLVEGGGEGGGGDSEESDSGEDETTPSRNEIVKELLGQQKTLEFGISMKAISILRYITDHLSELPLSVTTRLLNTHDVPCLLVGLLQKAPWTKTGDSGKHLRYEDGQWRQTGPEGRLKLTKLEGQVWLTLYRLLMGPDCQPKYQLNQHNKATILRLRAHLSEPLLEQIPNLADLQRYLQHLSFMDPPPAKSELILEQVPAIYEKLVKDHSGKWAAIAKRHSKLLLEPSPEEVKEQAKRWVDTYNLDVLESLVAGPPTCVLCGREACKRCSRCRNEWYCGRECQVKHWKTHRTSCDLIAASPPES